MCKRCGKPGHIDRFCFMDPAILGPAITTETSNNRATKRFNKGLSCCLSKVNDQKIEQQIALTSAKIEVRHVCNLSISVTIDLGATDYFFANHIFFTLYREFYHEF